jgi:histidinol-phosphate/aromatic aminotransferase/cobyric acid decarboxylase-like protein
MGDRYVRITVGTHEQNLRLIDALRSIREKA